MKIKIILTVATILFTSCTTSEKKAINVSTDSIAPGTSVRAGGNDVKLYDTKSPLKVGESMHALLTDLGATDLVGKVAVINVVPSVDTPVCEEQSHILGETTGLSPQVTRVSISRDLPMAAKRFAKEAKLENILYFSDYKTGAFGQKSGLMMKGNELLARAVIVIDTQAVIKHIQVVPDVTFLPNMAAAFAVANGLVGWKPE